MLNFLANPKLVALISEESAEEMAISIATLEKKSAYFCAASPMEWSRWITQREFTKTGNKWKNKQKSDWGKRNGWDKSNQQSQGKNANQGKENGQNNVAGNPYLK